MSFNAVKTIKTSKFAVLDGKALSTPSSSPILSSTEVFNLIFKDIPANYGLKLSLAERKTKDDPYLKGQSFIYGEFDQCDSIHSLLRATLALSDKKTQLSFCDLGSGTGKISVAAALFRLELDSEVFSICYGIELIESLFQESMKAADSLVATNDDYRDRISFLCGDLLTPQYVSIWTECDLVIANSTCFDEILMQDIAERATAMRPGTVFVTLSKPLPDVAGFALIDELRLPTSW